MKRAHSSSFYFPQDSTQPNIPLPSCPRATVKQIKQGTQRKPGGLKKTLIAEGGRGVLFDKKKIWTLWQSEPIERRARSVDLRRNCLFLLDFTSLWLKRQWIWNVSSEHKVWFCWSWKPSCWKPLLSWIDRTRDLSNLFQLHVCLCKI